MRGDGEGEVNGGGGVQVCGEGDTCTTMPDSRSWGGACTDLRLAVAHEVVVRHIGNGKDVRRKVPLAMDIAVAQRLGIRVQVDGFEGIDGDENVTDVRLQSHVSKNSAIRTGAREPNKNKEHQGWKLRVGGTDIDFVLFVAGLETGKEDVVRQNLQLRQVVHGSLIGCHDACP